MITIKQISITDLNTDAIVNAANEHLQAGGGVCGAIFSAAGHKRLQAACDEIKHCDTGSAVITSGFDLKAKLSSMRLVRSGAAAITVSQKHSTMPTSVLWSLLRRTDAIPKVQKFHFRD